MTDITDKHESEQPYPESCEFLEDADRMHSLSALTKGLAHRVRNPLSAIMLFADIMADPKRFARSDQEMEILAEIKKNVRVITDIITGILDFTEDTLSSGPVDINQVIKDALYLRESLLKQARIKAVFSPASDLPLITGNHIALQQAIGNLIGNGSEAMTKGGALTITTAKVQSTVNTIMITCTDSGPGIKGNLKKQIFAPFFSTKRNHSGLGLPVTRQIVERHGGRVYCSCGKAGATVFTIELPCARPSTYNKKGV